MSNTIENLDEGYRQLRMQVNGDGNGNKGLTRRLDASEQRQEATEKRFQRFENLLWTILSAVVISMVVTLLQKTYGPAPTQSVSQSVSTTAPDGMPATTAYYSTPQLAKLLGYSEREIQDRAAKNEIPGAWKDGKAWRFDRPSIDSWISANAAVSARAATSADSPRDQ